MEYQETSLKNSFFKSRRFIIGLVVAIVVIAPIIVLVVNKKKATVNTEAASSDAFAKIDSIRQLADANPTFDNLLNLGIAFINANAAGQAINPLERALELKPDNAIALNNLGLACTMVRAVDKGIKYCSLALEQDTAFVLAKNNLNWAKSEEKKIVAEIDSLEKQPKENHTVDYYTKLGLIYSYIGKRAKSNEAYKEILKLDGKSAVAYNNIACNYIEMKEFANAKEALQNAIAIAPDVQLYKNNLAWAEDEEKKSKAGRGVTAQ